MAVYERNTRFSQYSRTDGSFDSSTTNDVPLGELLRRLGQDASALVRNEIALAKIEMRESVKGYTQNVAKIAVAAGVGLVGVLALTAFLIVGLGDVLDNYWLSALIVSVLFLATAGIMAKGAINRMKENSLTPEETVRTLKDDQRWAKHEAQDFKKQIKA